MKLCRLISTSLFSLLIMSNTLFADENNNLLGPAPAPTTYPDLLASQNSYMFSAVANVQNNDSSSTETFNYQNNSSLQGIIDNFDDDELSQQIDDYDEHTASVSGVANLRGVKAYLNSWVNSDGLRQLSFCIPLSTLGKLPSGTQVQTIHTTGGASMPGACVNFIQSYGASATSTLTRVSGGKLRDNETISTEDVFQQLVDWLKGQGGSLLQSVSDAWVSQTSIDPVAGNPNSFMAQLTNENFNLAATNTVSGESSGLNLFTLAPSYSNETNNGFTVKSAYLPLRYTHFFDQDNALIVDMPLNYSQVAEAETYSAALGFGYMHMFIDNSLLSWAVTPSIYAGAVGSIDMGSGTALYDGAIASRVTIPTTRIIYGVTNDISYLQTSKVTIGSVETPYDLNDTITQNGLDATYKFNDDYTLGGYFTRTDVIGGATWYIPDYNQVGIKVAKLKNFQHAIYDNLSLTLGYMFAEQDFEGVTGTFTFNF